MKISVSSTPPVVDKSNHKFSIFMTDLNIDEMRFLDGVFNIFPESTIKFLESKGAFREISKPNSENIRNNIWEAIRAEIVR